MGDIAATYNAFKTFEGKVYTGTRVGRHQKWDYDRGEWKEDKRFTPDKWEFNYAVTKRRAGHAPEGSGAAVGTQYHGFILAHQIVRKVNANDYTISMSGLKYKLTRKRAGKDKWNISETAQRRRLTSFLTEALESLEDEEKPKTGNAEQSH